LANFVSDAALLGGFTVNITSPPKRLRLKSQEYFSGNSDFDLCVYATALDYLDFCISGYTIADKRSLITTMFETTNDPIYLILPASHDRDSSWESFYEAIMTIFQPFTTSTWLMIFFFAFPCLSILMVSHEEYDSPGSAFPKMETVLIKESDGRINAVAKHIPLRKHMVNALYMGMLSFFWGAYKSSVVMIGGKINLLGIVSFVMIILAVYTANLTAILPE
jgi:hypothetical protein